MNKSGNSSGEAVVVGNAEFRASVLHALDLLSETEQWNDLILPHLPAIHQDAFQALIGLRVARLERPVEMAIALAGVAFRNHQERCTEGTQFRNQPPCHAERLRLQFECAVADRLGCAAESEDLSMRSMLIKLLPSRWMVAEQIQDLADAWRFVRSVEEVPDLSPDRLTAQFQDRLSEFGEHTNESPPESTTLSRELSIRGDEDFSAALNEAASLAFSRADDWYVHALQKLQVVSGEGNIFRSSLIRKLCRLRISRATAAAADVASLAGYLVNEATYRAFGRVPWWAATHRDNAVSSLLAQIRFLERTDAPRAETDCLICHAVMLSDESVPMGLRNYVLSMLSG